MFTPGITTLRMKHAVSGLEESDLALLDVFQCCLREVSACCHVACQCIQYLIVFCSVVIVGYVLICIQAYSFYSSIQSSLSFTGCRVSCLKCCIHASYLRASMCGLTTDPRPE